jgi:hypothetical protein
MHSLPTGKNLQLLLDKGFRRALVLGGGGAKGCYQVGAWQAFDELDIEFDGTAGTSIGAIIGSLYTEGRLHHVTDFVLGMEPEHIACELPQMPSTLKDAMQQGKTIFNFLLKYYETRMDIRPLKERFDAMFDYEEFHNSPVRYACMTFNDTKKEPRPFFKDEMTEENAQDIIMASAACYPAFPKVRIGDDEYIDGGYADNVPLELGKELMESQEEDKEHPVRYTIIDLRPPQSEKLEGVEEDMVYIRPLLYPGKSLDFSTGHARRLYAQGYLETRKYLETAPGYLYTFRNEDRELIDAVQNYLQSCLDLYGIEFEDLDSLAKDCFNKMLGYIPAPLKTKWTKEHRLVILLEALALLAGVEPVAMYSYKDFLLAVNRNLAERKVRDLPNDEYKLLEMFSSLKKDELPAWLHRMLVKGNGRFSDRMEKNRDIVPVSSTFALLWYWLEQLCLQLEPEDEPEQEEKPKQELLVI